MKLPNKIRSRSIYRIIILHNQMGDLIFERNLESHLRDNPGLSPSDKVINLITNKTVYQWNLSELSWVKVED